MCYCCTIIQVRDQSTLLDKVQVVGGDISLPGLGLDEQSRQFLISNVHFIMHCAADIRLEADIQVGSCSSRWLELQLSCTHTVEPEWVGLGRVQLRGFLSKACMCDAHPFNSLRLISVAVVEANSARCWQSQKILPMLC